MAAITDEFPESGKLLGLMNGEADRLQALWFGFLAFGAFVIVAAGSADYLSIFSERPVNLPVLNINLPLVGFFIVAPLLLTIFHVFFLVKLLLLKEVHDNFEQQVAADIKSESDRLQIRKLTNTSIFLQVMRERSGNDRMMRVLLWAIIVVTVLLLPLAGLVETQGMFLAYQSNAVAWWHRLLIAVDIAAMIFAISRFKAGAFSARDLPWAGPLGIVFALAFFVSMFLLTIPLGPVDQRLTRLGLFVFQLEVGDHARKCPDPILGRYINHVHLGDRTLIDDRLYEERAKLYEHRPLYKHPRTIIARGRRFVCADFNDADLRGANLRDSDFRDGEFGGAHLDGADLRGADMRGADFEDADLTGANVRRKGDNKKKQDRLKGAKFSNARLTGAKLSDARFENVNFDGADFCMTELKRTQFANIDLRNVRNLTQEQIDQADMDEATMRQLPESRQSRIPKSKAELKDADDLDEACKSRLRERFKSSEVALELSVTEARDE